VIVLVSDGQPTDDFGGGVAALDAQPWGSKAVRLGIAIGRDADHEVLRRFIGDPAVPILEANAPEALVRQIRWASTIGLASASSPTMGGMAAPPGVDVPIQDRSPGSGTVSTLPGGSSLAGVTSEALRAATSGHRAAYGEAPGNGTPGGVLRASQEDELEIW
jgi:hypothetical protein